MKTPSRYSRPARALLVAAMTALVAPACGGGAAADAQSQQERQELEQRLVSLEATVDELRAQVARQQQDSAVGQQEKEQLATRLAGVEQQLADARRLLDTQDWDGVLVKLDAARAELAQLQGRLAATDGSLELHAALYVGAQPLALDTPYALPGGQLTFSELRYWLSNVKLQRQDGTQVALPGSYYLIEAVKEQPVHGSPSAVLPAHRRERVQVSAVPAGSYTGITFSVGVDPTYNDDLSRQAGELHTLKNMTRDTWMWFTSYIFTKTKGSYVKADGSTDVFAWETGGNGDFRTVQRAFASPVTVNSQKQLTVNLRLDASKLFAELHPRTTPTVGASHATERAQVSNGFAAGFSLVSVENPNR